MSIPPKERKEKAGKIIHLAASSSAGTATLLSQAIGADTTIINAIISRMVLALAKLYDKELETSNITSILGYAAGATMGVTGAKTLLGFIPGLGNLTNGCVTFGCTEALGWRVYNYFEGNSEELESIAIPAKPQRRKVFICYSHKDSDDVDKFRICMKCWSLEGIIEEFHDTMIKPGTIWKQEIQKAIDSARIAVLFVSPDFPASDYIQQNELPPLLHAAEKGDVVVFPILVRPTPRTKQFTDLLEFQSPAPISESLVEMKEAQKEKVIAQITEAIVDILKSNTLQ